MKKNNLLDLELAVKIAMMHDLYEEPWQNRHHKVSNFFHLHGFRHPIEASINAAYWFKDEFRDIERARKIIDGIVHHMYPLPVNRVKNFDTNLLSTLIDMVEKDYEYIVIDYPAGIENGLHSAIKRATKAIVVLNDEPNSYSDGRKVTRILKAKRIKEIHYVINKYSGKQYEKDKIRQFVASYYLSSNCYFLPLFNNIKKMKMHQIIKKDEVQKLTYNITKNIK